MIDYVKLNKRLTRVDVQKFKMSLDNYWVRNKVAIKR